MKETVCVADAIEENYSKDCSQLVSGTDPIKKRRKRQGREMPTRWALG